MAKRTSPASRSRRRPASPARKPIVRYDQRLFDVICERLAEGRSLRSVCSDPGMPSESAVRHWVLEDTDECAARYEQARVLGADALGDELMDLARDERMKTVADAAVMRARADITLKLLSKIAPKRWGERIDPAQPAGGAVPVALAIHFHDPQPRPEPADAVIDGEARRIERPAAGDDDENPDATS